MPQIKLGVVNAILIESIQDKRHYCCRYNKAGSRNHLVSKPRPSLLRSLAKRVLVSKKLRVARRAVSDVFPRFIGVTSLRSAILFHDSIARTILACWIGICGQDL